MEGVASLVALVILLATLYVVWRRGSARRSRGVQEDADALRTQMIGLAGSAADVAYVQGLRSTWKSVGVSGYLSIVSGPDVDRRSVFQNVGIVSDSVGVVGLLPHGLRLAIPGGSSVYPHLDATLPWDHITAVAHGFVADVSTEVRVIRVDVRIGRELRAVPIALLDANGRAEADEYERAAFRARIAARLQSR